MKPAISLTATILLAVLFLSCDNSATKQEDAIKKDSSLPVTENKIKIDSNTERPLTLTAQFVDFTLGDASHFIFKDKAGKSWDFGDNKDSLFKFAAELPKNKANEMNQGWGPDKRLQGKWFDITYIYKDQPEYTDGPMAKVPIIISVRSQD
jgi:hypothetical protein